MKKVYIFDFDFTLADSSEGVLECVCYALGKMNRRVPAKAEIDRTIGLSLDETFVRLTGDKDKASAQAFFRLFVERADQAMADCTFLFKNTRTTLKSLHRSGKKMAIVSTKFRYRIEAILRCDDCFCYVDKIIGGEDVSRPKPDPEGVMKVLRFFGCPQADAVFVGDSPLDALTAKNAGIDFIASLSGTAKKEDFRPYKVIKFITDIYELGRPDSP